MSGDYGGLPEFDADPPAATSAGHGKKTAQLKSKKRRGGSKGADERGKGSSSSSSAIAGDGDYGGLPAIPGAADDYGGLPDFSSKSNSSSSSSKRTEPRSTAGGSSQNDDGEYGGLPTSFGSGEYGGLPLAGDKGEYGVMIDDGVGSSRKDVKGSAAAPPAAAVGAGSIASLSVDGLAEKLLSLNVSKDSVEKLRVQNIDGAVLGDLSKEDLDEMGVKAVGDRIKIQKLGRSA